MKKTQQNRVTVSFFEGRQGKLWLALLILAPLFAAAFAVFAVMYADDGILVIVGCCAVSAVCLFVFGVCIATARTRTSRWTADETGIAYCCLGRRVLFMKWEDVREAGFLRLEGERKDLRLCLYWSGAELRGKLKSGAFAGRMTGLGANRSNSSMIVYPVPAYYGDGGGIWYPSDDPLIVCTRTHVRRPLRHEEFLSASREK